MVSQKTADPKVPVSDQQRKITYSDLRETTFSKLNKVTFADLKDKTYSELKEQGLFGGE